MRALLLALLLAGCGSDSVEITNGLALDGDTFDAGGVRYRLADIDAPEMPGHCRPGRICVSGDPFAAKAALQAMLDNGAQCDRITTDHYGRTIARCYRGALNIGDVMVASGHAIHRYGR